MAACDNGHSLVDPNHAAPGTVIEAGTGHGTDNVLAAHVAVVTTGVDSVRAVYWTGRDTLMTPFHAPAFPVDSVLILGLQPSTSYSAVIELAAKGSITRSSRTSFTTSPLPATVASFAFQRLAGTAAPALAMTALNANTGGYAVVFDSVGRVVWYRDLTGLALPVSDLMQQPNGNFTAFVGGTNGWMAVDGYYVEMAPSGKIVRTYRAPPGYYTDDHEVRLTGDASEPTAHFLTYDIRPFDFSAIGGSSTASVAGHQVIRVAAAGGVQFTFNAWDNFTFDDKVGEESGALLDGTDFDHPNALSIDASGDYIVSWRDLNQVTAIDPSTGAVKWRIGGVRGEYQFVGDSHGGFSKQHYAHLLPNGNLLVYDNGDDAEVPETRAVEYKLDHAAKTATVVWEFKHTPAIYTPYVGNVDRLADGSSWIGYAFAGRVSAVSAAGETLWEGQVTIDGADASTYRILPLRSLYEFRAP